MAENKTTTAKAEVKKKETEIIRIPKTKEDKGDVFVGINGYTYLIKRGETVEVPKAVAEVLRHQEKMIEENMLFIEEAEAKAGK